MFLNFKKIKLREDGTPERPILRLQTLYGKTLGVITNAYNLEIEINYSSLSEISFDVARWVDGVENPIYDQLAGFKLIYTDALGIYVLQRPETTGDGMSEVKHITGYSLEQLREGKLLYLEEGTYNFWNPVDRENTILQRILELFPQKKTEGDNGWSVGEVDPKFIGMYRTFDSYNQDVIQFCYNDASEKFQCVFVFDVYEKTINVYDANESRGTLPIYLGYENLVKETKVTELSDEIVTKLHVYGDDGLTITACNPLGTDYIIDLSHYVENGDLDVIASDSDVNLSEKYQQWKLTIDMGRENFLALASARANALAQELALEVELATLNEEYETLRVEQGAIVQAIALTNDDGKPAKQAELDTKNAQMAAKEKEISEKQDEISSAKDQMDSYQSQMRSISQELLIENYFTEGEQLILEEYLQEQELSEETFVATDIATDTSGASGYFSGSVAIAPGESDCKIYQLDVTEPTAKTLYSIAGGVFSAQNSGDKAISGDIVRGTLEVGSETSVLSLYLCGVTYEKSDTTDHYESGMLTIRGKLSGLSGDIATKEEDGVEVKTGSKLSFSLVPTSVAEFSTSTQYYYNKQPNLCKRSGNYYRCVTNTKGAWNINNWMRTEQYNLFLSASVTAYQRYSVARELYDFGEEALHDMATPTYEFDLETSNFIFLNEFTSFKDVLDMGKGVYVKLRKSGEAEHKQGRADVIEANLIGLSFSYEDLPRLSLTFSNRFKKRNGVKTLEGMIKNSYSSTRSFDTSRYVYGKVTEHAGEVEQAMKSNLDVAKNKIVGAHDQSVEISESGIHVSGIGDGNRSYQLRIIDSMIAMSDDNWQTAKLAIGRFDGGEAHWDSTLEPEKTGPLWGVNADVIFGKQLVGQSMIIESRGDNADGTAQIKQFKFDAGGAWMNNATLTIQNNTSRISIDPTYGIVGGTHDIFSSSGTDVTYNFIDSNGHIKRDKYGLPSTSNSQSGGVYPHEDKIKFFLDLQNGNAYFNGTIFSKSGLIGGWNIQEGQLDSGQNGTRVALNSDPDNAYAIWCGANDPEDAPFWVKKNGDMKAKNGMFTGQLITTGRGQLAEDGDIDDLPDINMDGDNISDSSALYIFDTTPNGDTPSALKEDTYKDLVGFIAYDEKGSGIDEATDRVIFRTTSSHRYTTPDGHGQTTQYLGVPIKIQSGSDMSLECKQISDSDWTAYGDGGERPIRKIHMMSPTAFHGEVEMNDNTINVSTIAKSTAKAGGTIDIVSPVKVSEAFCLSSDFYGSSGPSGSSYEGAIYIKFSTSKLGPDGTYHTVPGDIYIYSSGRWRSVYD